MKERMKNQTVSFAALHCARVFLLVAILTAGVCASGVAKAPSKASAKVSNNISNNISANVPANVPVDSREGSVRALALVRKIPFSGYSEGIDYSGGFLWSALPQQLRKIDPNTGEVLQVYSPATKYSESIVWWKDFLWTVSYEDNGIYKGRANQTSFEFQQVGSTPEVHAWGIAHDGKHLLLTGDHGSSHIYFVNPTTLKVEKKLKVQATDLEDLAWDGKGIWTSSFTSHRGKIFRVHPVSGKIEAVFEIPEPAMCPIVDGIAVQDKMLWITGKNCPSVYLVKNPL